MGSVKDWTPMPVKKEFRQGLRDIWKEWDEDGFAGSPFNDIHEGHPWWAAPGISYQIGFITGISAATGWSLDRPKS